MTANMPDYNNSQLARYNYNGGGGRRNAIPNKPVTKINAPLSTQENTAKLCA